MEYFYNLKIANDENTYKTDNKKLQAHYYMWRMIM